MRIRRQWKALSKVSSVNWESARIGVELGAAELMAQNIDQLTMSLHQFGVELEGFAEVLLGEPSPMSPQLDLPGHEMGLSGHWVLVGNSRQSRHGFLGAPCAMSSWARNMQSRGVGSRSRLSRFRRPRPDRSGRRGRLPPPARLRRDPPPCGTRSTESRQDGQDHDDRGDPGSVAAPALELPARSLRTRLQTSVDVSEVMPVYRLGGRLSRRVASIDPPP